MEVLSTSLVLFYVRIGSRTHNIENEAAMENETARENKTAMENEAAMKNEAAPRGIYGR